MGYHRAGFTVVGIDHKPQPRYPFEFIQADALEYVAEHGHEFDAIHASPPCQAYLKGMQAVNKMFGRSKAHPDLVEPTRAVLIASGRPSVIENIIGAPLLDPIRLCGSSFGLRVQRHRLFEGAVPLLVPPCQHRSMLVDVVTRYAGRGSSLRRALPVYGHGMFNGPRLTLEQGQEAMGIDWMKWDELSQAIPPAYTEFIGKQLMAVVG